MTLGPRTLKALEDGPQRPHPCQPCNKTGVRLALDGKTTCWCSCCDGTGGIAETSSEFARRVALIAVQEERERWESECRELSAGMCIIPDALRLGAGGNPYCEVNEMLKDAAPKARRYEWLLHTANEEEIRETLLSREPWHHIDCLIDAKIAGK